MVHYDASRLLKRFGTSEKKMILFFSKACILRDVKRFGTAKKENKDGNWCILTVFKTI